MTRSIWIIAPLLLAACGGERQAEPAAQSPGAHSVAAQSPGEEQAPPEEAAEAAEAVAYACPMHPEQRHEGPGDCPICGMHMVPEEGPEAGSMDHQGHAQHQH